MLRVFPALIAVLSSGGALAQSFTFELLELGREPPRVISKGTIFLRDRPTVSVSPEGKDSRVLKRELGLPGGWAVGCTDYREPTPKGFGCWLARRPNQLSLDKYDGFSWEWFDLDSGFRYVKRKGGAHATLKQSMNSGLPSFVALQFDDEAVFSVNVGPPKAGVYTHELRIQAGSVLPLAEAVTE